MEGEAPGDYEYIYKMAAWICDLTIERKYGPVAGKGVVRLLAENNVLGAFIDGIFEQDLTSKARR